MVKVIFHTIRNCSKREELAPSGSKFFPLKEDSILKRDTINPDQIAEGQTNLNLYCTHMPACTLIMVHYHMTLRLAVI